MYACHAELFASKVASRSQSDTCSAPLQVDWLGQRAQIDVAVQHGYKQVQGFPILGCECEEKLARGVDGR